MDGPYRGAVEHVGQQMVRGTGRRPGGDGGELKFEPLTESEISELLPNYEIIALIDRGGMANTNASTTLLCRSTAYSTLLYALGKSAY